MAEKILNIAQRLNAVMKEVDYIQKEEKAGMKYTIVSHDKVTALVRPLLVKHGVVYYPTSLEMRVDGNRTEASFSVRFENIDDRTDYLEVATMGFGIDTQDKGPGKALSYGVKYALLKVLGLETGDDPDLDQHSEHRTTLDQRVDNLELLVGSTENVEALTTLMNEAFVKEIMTALSSRNAGRHMAIKGIMSRKIKELKNEQG